MSNPSFQQIILGIDLGKDGAFFFIDTNGEVKHWFDMPTKIDSSIDSLKIYSELCRVIQYYNLHVAFERCFPIKAGGALGNFTFGKNIKAVEAVIEILEIPFCRIVPENWKKEYSLVNKSKKDSVKIAVELQPSLKDVFIEPFGKQGRVTFKDDRAEAYLIAEYYRRKLNLPKI